MAIKRKTEEFLQSAQSTQDDTITLTREELNNILASFKQEILAEIEERNIIPLRKIIIKAKEQSELTTQTLNKLEEKLDEIYAPIKYKKQAEAAARLAARNYEEDDE